MFSSLDWSCLGLCGSSMWTSVSFHKSGKISAIMSSNTFSAPFSFFSLSWSLIMCMLVHVMLSQNFLKLFSFLFIFFGYHCSSSEISTTLSPISMMYFSAPFNLLLIPSSVFLFQLFFISLWFFFKNENLEFSNTLLKTYNFSSSSSVSSFCLMLLFISMCLVDCYIYWPWRSGLCIPKVHPSLVTRAIYFKDAPYVGQVCPSVMVSWILRVIW